MSCERTLHSMLPSISERKGSAPPQLHQIAEDMKWLLFHSPMSLGIAAWRDRYVALLSERNFVTPGGTLRLNDIEREIQNYYSDEVLTMLDCPLQLASEDKTKTWIHKFLQHRGNHSPLEHLLFIRFLEQMPETFLTYQSFAAREPFGGEPWPCLNRAADHYGELIVEQINVHPHRKGKTKSMVIGTFVCACGFAYARKGPDSTNDDRYRFDFVRSYGPIWDKALRTMWNDDTMTLQDIADALGVYRELIVRRAARLRLPFPRRCLRSRNRMHALRKPPGPGQTNWLSKRQTYRQRWLTKYKDYPNFGRKDLRVVEPRAYMWLIQHDRDWLNRHMPDKRSGGKQHN